MIKKRNQTGNSVEAYACACLYASSCTCHCSCSCERHYVTDNVWRGPDQVNGNAVYNEYNFRSEVVNG